MSELWDTYDAINALWKTVPEQAMKEAVPAVAPKVFDWLWNRIGASDYFDLLPVSYRDEVRAKNWSERAVIANAGFPGGYKPETTLRDLVHYNSHWVDQHLRGSLDPHGGHFNHDVEHARLELELTTLVVNEWLPTVPAGLPGEALRAIRNPELATAVRFSSHTGAPGI